LVQNGNFSEIGSDLVTNGDFSAAGINLVSNPNFTDTAADEVTYPNFTNSDISQWVINSGRAAKTWDAAEFMQLDFLIADGGAFYALFGQTLNASYKVTMRVRGTKSDGTTAQGSAFSSIGDGNELGQVISNPTLTSAWQDYEFYVVSTSSVFRFYLASAAVGDLVDFDSISVKELGEDWTVLEDTCTFGENGLTMTSTEGADLRISTNTSPLEDSTSYKVTYTIYAVGLTGTNTIQYYSGDGVLSWQDLPEQGVGTHTFYYTTPSSTNNNWYFKLNLDGSTSTTDFVTISSISVQELGADWTIINSGTASTYFGENKVQLVTSGDYTDVTQLQTIDINTSYKYSFEIVDFFNGSAIFQIGGATVATETGNGVYSGYYTSPTGNDHMLFKRDGACDLGITNITVQELDPNGYWTLVGSGLTIGEDKGIYTDAGVGSYFKNTSFVVVDGKTYRGSFDIPELTEGGLSWQTALGTVSISPNYGAADTGLTFDFVGDGSTGIKCIGTTLDNTSAITNLSVKLLGTYDDQSIYVTAADVQTIAQASVYYLVELTSMASRNSLYFLPSSVVPNNGRYTKLNFTVISKDALPTPASGIISFYDSVGGFDTYPMGFYEFRIYEQTSSTNLDPLLATGLLEKGFAFVRDFSGNMQELTDGFKEYNPTLTQYVYSK
jgi:hypothetical protein